MMPDAVPTKPPPSRPAAASSEDRATIVGTRLRQIFDEVAAEPLPDAFRDLLRKLG